MKEKNYQICPDLNNDLIRYIQGNSELLKLDLIQGKQVRGLLSKISLKYGGGIKINNKWYSLNRFKSVIKIGVEQNDNPVYIEVIN